MRAKLPDPIRPMPQRGRPDSSRSYRPWLHEVGKSPSGLVLGQPPPRPPSSKACAAALLSVSHPDDLAGSL